MTAKASEIELRHRPLKVLYPEVELRKKYQQSRLQSVKSNNSVFIRLEPNDKYCKIEGNFFISIIAPVNYQMGYLLGTLRQRLIKQNVYLNQGQSLFLFFRKNLMTNFFKEKIGPFWQKNKEEDDILYLEYADSAPF